MSTKLPSGAAKMSQEQLKVCFGGGTERAFTGKYWNLKADGQYHCAGCDVPLFK